MGESPDYRVLYSNLNDRDGGAIVTQLTQMNIPYRFAENGAALLIPAERCMKPACARQQGLPKGGAVGFELLDQENSASASSASRSTISVPSRRAVAHYRIAGDWCKTPAFTGAA